MIDKIFIPTVNRIDNQITYNALPDELKRQVVFVVQSWEVRETQVWIGRFQDASVV